MDEGKIHVSPALTRTPRITLFKYAPLHFAVDCEECDRKIANLDCNKTSGQLIDQINDHLEKVHRG